MFSDYWYVQDNYVAEQSENNEGGPLIMNAFEMITLSQGLNLSALFDRGQVELLILQLCNHIPRIEVLTNFSYSTIPEVRKCLWRQHMDITMLKSSKLVLLISDLSILYYFAWECDQVPLWLIYS